jgi:chaperonin GroEL
MDIELKDTLLYDQEAKQRLIDGINKVADAVRVTLGPGGRNVILGGEHGEPVVTKDGVC